ncbi:hypothetical protein QL285_044738 [Trifolium repens]|nr:hypothetical protein QL285_044738 [Trifolium repens]
MEEPNPNRKLQYCRRSLIKLLLTGTNSVNLGGSQYKTNAIALEHRPDDVGEDDWKFLVDYFSSPNYKVISERNKLNKAKQVINHRCGRKSIQAVSYDARDPETQKERNYQDLWRMTHTNSNGEWINDASKEVHTKVQERCSELMELGYMDEDKDKLTNTAFEAVVGGGESSSALDRVS